MGESARPTIRQLRGLYLLLGECCELGADGLAWRQHLSEQLPALFGAQVGLYAEYAVVAEPFRELHWLRPEVITDFGWPTPSDRKPFEEHIELGRPELGPHVVPELFQRRLKVFHWSGDLGRSTWKRSAFFNDPVKRTHLDDGLFAHHLMDAKRLRWLFVNRELGDRPFTARERRLMGLLNAELAGLLGPKLARIDEPGVSDLPQRLRDVLRYLMEGETEKQTAIRLGISTHTVHEYVRRLYKRFGVSSRGELLAYCRKLWPVLTANGDGHSRFS